MEKVERLSFDSTLLILVGNPLSLCDIENFLSLASSQCKAKGGLEDACGYGPVWKHRDPLYCVSHHDSLFCEVELGRALNQCAKNVLDPSEQYYTSHQYFGRCIAMKACV